MPGFEFPPAPATGDDYTIGGIVYTWTGTNWDIKGGNDPQDFILRAGDAMTGPLGLPEMVGPTNVTGGDLNLMTNSLEVKEGIIVARKNHIYAQGGGRFIWNNTDNNAWQNFFSCNGGIHFQYHQGGNNDGRFRLFTSNGGYSDAYVFETTIVSGAPGIIVNGNMSAGSVTSRGGMTSAGLITSSVAQGSVALQLNDGARINFSSGCLIYKNYGSNDFMFHTNASQVFTFHISGTGDVYVIDTVGSVGNSVNVTAPESLAIAGDLGLEADAERGVDVMRVVGALAAKVKQLEAEIAQLRAQPRGRR